MLKQLQFFSVASDGRVTLWTLAKSELLHQVLILFCSFGDKLQEQGVSMCASTALQRRADLSSTWGKGMAHVTRLLSHLGMHCQLSNASLGGSQGFLTATAKDKLSLSRSNAECWLLLSCHAAWPLFSNHIVLHGAQK